MRLHFSWIALSLVAAGCSVGQATPSQQTGKTAGPPGGSHMKMAKPLARAKNPLLGQGGDPGDDDTFVSQDPTLSALCSSYAGQLGLYPPPVPDVDAIVGDSLVATGSQKGCDTAQDETAIATNPANFKNLVAGSNDYRVFNAREGGFDGSGWAYTTFDGGQTWTNTVLPHLTIQTGATGALSDMDSAGDPAVAFGPNNTVYYANLVFSRLNSASGIAVSTSTDGGVTWGEPSIVHLDGVDASGNPLDTAIFNDKEWISVDLQSGTVYVTWTQFGPSDSPIVVSSSTDGGATWSPPSRVNPVFTPGGITAYSSGSNPQVGRDGTLYVAYESAVCATLACDQPTDMDATIVASSTDGGQTFTSTVVGQNFDFPNNADTGRSTLTGENFRINSFPQLGLDYVTGQLLVTWADDRNGQYDPTTGASIQTNGDVIVSSSTDGGATWSDPLTLGTSADEVYPAVAANRGRMVVSFYTRSYATDGVGIDYAAITGPSFSSLEHQSLRRLSSETSNPQVQFVSIGAVTNKVLQGVFIGDYTGVALGPDGVFHAAWTDFRGNPGVTAPNQDVYVASGRI
jgi:hypothetical protein